MEQSNAYGSSMSGLLFDRPITGLARTYLLFRPLVQIRLAQAGVFKRREFVIAGKQARWRAEKCLNSWVLSRIGIIENNTRTVFASNSHFLDDIQNMRRQDLQLVQML